MLKDLKSNITELAYAAVSVTEETLNTATGQEKKKAALEYVISLLPIASPLKCVVSILLGKFIDEAIEKAVQYMKSIKNSEAK